MSKNKTLKQEIARLKKVNTQQQADAEQFKADAEQFKADAEQFKTIAEQQRVDIAEVERILNELEVNPSPVNIIKKATGSKKSAFRTLIDRGLLSEEDTGSYSRTTLVGEIQDYLTVHGKKLTLINKTKDGVLDFYYFMKRYNK